MTANDTPFARLNKLTLEEVTLLADALAYVQNGQQDESYGICAAVEERFDAVVLHTTLNSFNSVGMLICEIATSWPNHSGCFHYPVPAVGAISRLPTGAVCSAELMYYAASGLWQGSYGALRKDLLQFIIGVVSERVDQLTAQAPAGLITVSPRGDQ